jgi:hypothetical protein
VSRSKYASSLMDLDHVMHHFPPHFETKANKCVAHFLLLHLLGSHPS